MDSAGQSWYKDVENPPFSDVTLDDNNNKDPKLKPNIVGSETLGTHLAYHLAGQVYESAKTQAGGFLNFYANLDLIRPYFDVELKVVVRRLAMSLVPRFSAEHTKGEADLYGPTMLAFTLVALVLTVLKLTNVVLEEGTLMGAAFAMCFSYWLVLSVLLRFTTYLLSVDVDIVDVSSVVGYGLFGYCVTLSAYCLSAAVSNVVLYIVGGLSSATLGAFFYAKVLPRNKTQAIAVGGVVSAIHFFYLFYLHYYFLEWL